MKEIDRVVTTPRPTYRHDVHEKENATLYLDPESGGKLVGSNF